MNKPAESTRFRVEAAREAAILRGDIRDDLIRDEVLADLFAATARARPDHPALVFGETRHSYGEVDARSDAIAGGLIERGIGPGDVVGLWMGRGPELLIAQIAIAKSGAAWLPFDADAPVDRIAVCLADAGAKGLVTSAALVAKAEVGCPVLTSDELARAGGGAPVDPKARGLTPDHPAYLIYTSGSTGTPKGIVVTHRNICHFLRASNALYGFTADDVVFQGASVAFDLSMEEIWIPYMVGATLVVASPATIGDAEKLPDILDRGRRHGARHRADAARAPQPRHPLRAADPARRRGAAAAARLPLVEARPAALQHLRPDRSDGRRDRLRSCAPASP